jgi:hypothetical protein
MKRTGVLCAAAVAALLILALAWLIGPFGVGTAPAQEKDKAPARTTGRATSWASGPAHTVEVVKGQSSVTVQAGRFYRGGDSERLMWVELSNRDKKTAEVWLSRDDVNSLLAWYNKAKEVRPSKKRAVATSGSVWTCTPSAPFGFRNPNATPYDLVTVTVEFGKDAAISFSRKEEWKETFSVALGPPFFEALADAVKDLKALEAIEAPLAVK